MNFGEIYPYETIFGKNGIIRQALFKSFDFFSHIRKMYVVTILVHILI